MNANRKPNEIQIKLLKKYKLTRRLLNEDGTFKEKTKSVWVKILEDKKVNCDFCLEFLDYLDIDKVLIYYKFTEDELDKIINYETNNILNYKTKLESFEFMSREEIETTIYEKKNKFVKRILFSQKISDEYILNKIINLEGFNYIDCLHRYYDYKVGPELSKFILDKLLSEKTNALTFKSFLSNTEQIEIEDILKIKEYIEVNKDDETLFDEEDFYIFGSSTWIKTFWKQVFQYHTNNTLIKYIIQNKNELDLDFETCEIALYTDFKSIELLESFINSFNVDKYGWDNISIYQTLNEQFILKYKENLNSKYLIENQSIVKESTKLQNILKGEVHNLGTLTIDFQYNNVTEEDVKRKLNELKEYLDSKDIDYTFNN